MKATTMLAILVLALGLAAEVAKADFMFGEPMNLGQGINSPHRDNTPSISADGLELYFASDRAGGYGNYDLWVTRRSTTDDSWGTPVNLGPTVNSSNAEVSPDISADGLSLYFDAGPAYRRDIWVAERAAKDQPWGTPVKLGPNVNRSTWQFCPSISPDGLHLYFDSQGQSTAWGIWMSSRQTHSEPWQPAVSLSSPIDSSYDESAADISVDGLAMFFHSDRPDGSGDQDLYVTTRPTIDANWGIPLNLGTNVNTAYSESDVSVSDDGRMIYFSEYPNPRPEGIGSLDIWQAPIIPIVDFNGDGIVDSADMCIMVDHWGENYSLCDIGPMPWGDGIVDVGDLKVLAEHLFEEPPQRPQVTTVVIVRHAERANGTLTEDGEKRAETLARLLSNTGVSAIFSTNYTRTIETANNTAERLGIPIQFYTSIQEVADLFKSEHAGKVVLVVGHSNTVSQTIEALGVSSAPPISGEYDNLFIVTIRPDGVTSLTHLKYDIHPDL